jgi:phosphinothricin acetyltransferase
MIVRAATAEDVAAIAGIYAHHVAHGLGTFEETPPDAAQMAERLAAVESRGLPWLVAEAGDALLGYAYAGPYNLRAAYRHTVEDSVYVAPDQAGRGVGRALLHGLLGRCEAIGVRQVIAVIGDSANVASIGLHRAMGFEMRGLAQSVGYKHGRWVDIVWMQRALGPGADAPPAPAR